MTYNLANGDCFEIMRHIPDKSIDGCRLFSEYKRVCKQNANVLLFCQMAFAKYLMDSTLEHEYSHCLIWEKGNKTRYKATALPASQYEMILCFRVNKYSNKDNHKSLRKYFMDELELSGVDVPFLEETIPNRSAHHWFRNSSDYRIPTEKSYERLQMITGRFERPYADIRREFMSEKKNTCTYNRGYINSDVIHVKLTEKRCHPTQKPVALLERLICAYSNEGDTILDNTMGSGSTGVACVNTRRNFVGIELDKRYFDIAENRIRNAEAAPRIPGMEAR